MGELVAVLVLIAAFVGLVVFLVRDLERKREAVHPQPVANAVPGVAMVNHASGVGTDALRLWEKLALSWPVLIARGWEPPLVVDGLAAERIERTLRLGRRERGYRADWRYADIAFRIEVTTAPSNQGPGEFGALILSADGEEVLKLAVNAKTPEGVTGVRYSFYDVSALKTGPWMRALAQFRAAIEAAETRHRRDQETEKSLEQAEQIGT